MMAKVRWGVLSTARIGVEKVIPGLKRGKFSKVVAIASREFSKAKRTADKLDIAKAYDSYEEILADSEIDAIYNPLPNNMHVPWSIKTLEAGKHVLCEKPLGMNAAQAVELLEVAERHPELKVMEAFMYRFHPQWQRAKLLVEEGAIGPCRTINSFFSYFNDNPHDIRNKPELGGGALLDIGCYNISLSRFILGLEPLWVFGTMGIDPEMGIDRRTSGVLDFGMATSTFTCATQVAPYQRVQIFGTEGRIEIEIPFNAPVKKRCRLWLEREGKVKQIKVEKGDQYAIQGDLFSQAIIKDKPVPTPLQDGIANMRIIDALRESAESGEWVELEAGISWS
jgi:predicted dehydrogenase